VDKKAESGNLLIQSLYLIEVDLDGNGLLSRDEFNLFNWRTSGEQVGQVLKGQYHCITKYQVNLA
jgi:hypothetical protein